MANEKKPQTLVALAELCGGRAFSHSPLSGASVLMTEGDLERFVYACGRAAALPPVAGEAVAGATDARGQEARSSQIITLCGSARFERLFKAWNEALTMAGHTVFSLTAYPSDKAGVKQWYTEEQKTALDAAHFRKIEASDAIFVLNLHAYIGESTLREIEYARKLGKAVYFLESWGKGRGIGGSHTDGAQRAAEADGLTLPTASPIDTTTRSGSKDPWASRLLGPAGPLRSAIVDLTKSAALASREQSPASPDAGAGAVAEQGVPDGVWEALQRMIEDGLVKGPASQEDARTVMRYRDRVRFLAAPASAPEQQGEAVVTPSAGVMEVLDAVLKSTDTSNAHRCEILDRFRAALAQAAPATGNGQGGRGGDGRANHQRDSDRAQHLRRPPRQQQCSPLGAVNAHARESIREALAIPAPTVQAETGEVALLRRTYDLLAHNETSADTAVMAQAHDDLRADIGVYLASAALTAVLADTKGGV